MKPASPYLVLAHTWDTHCTMYMCKRCKRFWGLVIWWSLLSRQELKASQVQTSTDKQETRTREEIHPLVFRLLSANNQDCFPLLINLFAHSVVVVFVYVMFLKLVFFNFYLSHWCWEGSIVWMVPRKRRTFWKIESFWPLQNIK